MHNGASDKNLTFWFVVTPIVVLINFSVFPFWLFLSVLTDSTSSPLPLSYLFAPTFGSFCGLIAALLIRHGNRTIQRGRFVMCVVVCITSACIFAVIFRWGTFPQI